MLNISLRNENGATFHCLEIVTEGLFTPKAARGAARQNNQNTSKMNGTVRERCGEMSILMMLCKCEHITCIYKKLRA